jgi:sugar phosphate permease
MLGALAVLGCVMLTWPLAATLPVALGLIAIGGFADGPGLAATFGARQRWTPRELLGQIFTTAASLKVGAFAIGAACAGPAVNTFGARGTLLLAAALQFTAVAVGLLLRRRPRRLDLQQEDGVHAERDGERDGPAVEVALHERSAAKRARARATDAERARQPAVLARVQEHQEDQDKADEDLEYREDGVHGGKV